MEMQLVNEKYRRYPIEFTVKINKYVLSDLLYMYFPEGQLGVILGDEDDSGNRYATFSVHMIPYLIPIFSYYNLNEALAKIHEIISIYKFECAFDKDCSRDYLTQEQFMVYHSMINKCGGIVQCRTGWGKGVLISYLITHYKGNGNILIIAPSLSVLDEMREKFTEFKVPEDKKSRVMFMHAAGFMASKGRDDPKNIEFLKNVDVIIVDESVNVTESMRLVFRNYCTNYRYIYGFSATANKYKHMELKFEKFKTISNLSPETISLLYYFGQSLAFITSKKGLVINKVYANLPPEYKVAYKSDNVNYQNAINSAIKNMSSVNYIRYVYQYNRSIGNDSVILFPVKEVAQGEYIYNTLLGNTISTYPDASNLYDRARFTEGTDDIKIVLWTGDGFVHNSDVEINSYSDLRTAIDNHTFDVVICTQVGYEGVNFQTINDIILMIGTSNKVVNQIVGRGERSDSELRIWLLFNANDMHLNYKNERDAYEMSTPIFNACNGARLRQLCSAHKYKINELGLLDNLSIHKGDTHVNKYV